MSKGAPRSTVPQRTPAVPSESREGKPGPGQREEGKDHAQQEQTLDGGGQGTHESGDPQVYGIDGGIVMQGVDDPHRHPPKQKEQSHPTGDQRRGR